MAGILQEFSDGDSVRVRRRSTGVVSSARISGLNGRHDRREHIHLDVVENGERKPGEDVALVDLEWIEPSDEPV